jgi:hypothetical protein
MKSQKGKTRYHFISFLHELLFFFISSFFSFPLHVKRIILCFVYSDDCNPTNAYYPLGNEDLSSSCTINLDLIPSCEPIEKDEVYVSISPKIDSYCKPVDYKVDTPSEVPVEPYNHPDEFFVQPTEAQLRIREIFKPLKMPPILNGYPPMFFEYLPLFKGDDHITVEKHIEAFEDFIFNFEIMHVDVILRLFSKSLAQDVTLWFRNMKACSIFSWTDLHRVFLRYWGENKSIDQYLIELNNMRRGKEESLATFNNRFHNFYCSMPLEIRPYEIIAMVYYTLAQHHELFLYIRERKSSSLEQMFINAEEIEENFRACGRLPK